MPPKLKVQLDKGAWQWAETTDHSAVTEEHIRMAYRLNLPTCQRGSCKRNCKGNPFCLTSLGEKSWFQPLDESKLQTYHHDEDRRQEGHFVGLKNLGATCYVNTFLQLWFHNPAVRRALYEWRDPTLPGEYYTGWKPDSICGHLQVIFALLQGSIRCYVDPSPLIECLGLNTAEQQDAQEFSKLFLHVLESSLSAGAPGGATNVIEQQFCGSYCYVTECQNCGSESERPATFYELDLNIRGHSTLSASIKDFLQEEKLEGDNQYMCSKCNSKQNAKRAIRLKRLPEVLNLQLLRFVFDKNKGHKKKLSSFIQFPETLDMSSYLKQGETTKQELYELSAVLIHRGPTAYSGHYIAHIREHETGAWYKFNDEEIEKMNNRKLELGKEEDSMESTGSEKAPKASKGNHSSRNAYMLVYRRKSDNDNETSTSAASGVTESDLPAAVRGYVDNDNQEFENFISEQLHVQEQSISDQKRTHEDMKAIYESLPVQSLDEPWEWVTTAWLSNWLTSPALCEKMKNKISACSHNKLQADDVVKMKCISSVGADMLFSRYPIDKRLPGPSQLCEKCVIKRCREIRTRMCMADDDKLFNSLKKFSVANPDEKMYWVSRKHLRSWKKFALGEIDSQPLNTSASSNVINKPTANATTPTKPEHSPTNNEENNISCCETSTGSRRISGGDCTSNNNVCPSPSDRSQGHHQSPSTSLAQRGCSPAEISSSIQEPGCVSSSSNSPSCSNTEVIASSPSTILATSTSLPSSSTVSTNPCSSSSNHNTSPTVTSLNSSLNRSPSLSSSACNSHDLHTNSERPSTSQSPGATKSTKTATPTPTASTTRTAVSSNSPSSTSHIKRKASESVDKQNNYQSSSAVTSTPTESTEKSDNPATQGERSNPSPTQGSSNTSVASLEGRESPDSGTVVLKLPSHLGNSSECVSSTPELSKDGRPLIGGATISPLTNGSGGQEGEEEGSSEGTSREGEGERKTQEEEEEEEEEKFNDDILCQHGNLKIDASGRRLVPAAVWTRLLYYFPHLTPFPQDSSVCQECWEEQLVEQQMKDSLRQEKQGQKELLHNLYHGKSRPRIGDNWGGQTAYVVCTSFVDGWRKFVKHSLVSESVHEIVNAPLFCHHGLLTYRPEDMNSPDNVTRFTLVWEEEWQALTRYYAFDMDIQFFQLQDEAGAWTINTLPAVCQVCLDDRLKQEEEGKFLFSGETIYIRKVLEGAGGDAKTEGRENGKGYNYDPEFNAPPHQKVGRGKHQLQHGGDTPPQKQMKLDNNGKNSSMLRKSSRHRKTRGEKELTVSSSMTLKQLQKELFKLYSVLPMDQNLSLDGRNLNNVEATLQELRVYPQCVIFLKADEPTVTTTSTVDDYLSVPTAPEEGFKGTNLLGR